MDDLDSTVTVHPGRRYGALVERRAVRQPDHTAFVCGGERTTYADLLRRILAAAAVLQEHGVGPGDRVVCHAENRVEVFVSLYACSRIGAVFTPIGIAATAPEVRFVVEDLEPSAVLVSEQASAILAEALGRGCSPRVLRLPLEPAGSTRGSPVASADPGPAVQPDAGAPAVIVYTSGTSGHPKGVVLTHGALFANSVNTLLGLDVLSDDVTLVNTPLSHIAALNTLAAATLHKGGTVVLESRFDAARCLEQIARQRITTTFAVPSMLTLMAQIPDFEDADLSSLRWVLGGGAPMPADLVALWTRRGCPSSRRSA